MSRLTFAIGDVHGCYYTLQRLLAKIPKDARIIFVGDLCDRGKYSKDVFDFVIKNGFEAVLGNHEDYMYQFALEAIEQKQNRWIDNKNIAGSATLASYDGDFELLLKHKEWIGARPRYIITDDIFITHGLGLPYFKRRDEKSAAIGLIKNRLGDEPDWGYEWERGWEKYPVFNIFGHTMYDKPLFGKNYCGIDTGCGAGRKLTAMNIHDKSYISVETLSKDFI